MTIDSCRDIKQVNRMLYTKNDAGCWYVAVMPERHWVCNTNSWNENGPSMEQFVAAGAFGRKCRFGDTWAQGGHAEAAVGQPVPLEE